MNRINELLHVADDRKILHTMTDEEWQKNFEILKTIVKPTNEKKLTRKCGHPKIINSYCSLTIMDGFDPLDKYYCNYINSILKVLRSKNKKNVDYCYYIFQIIELLRFEPNLQCKLVHNEKMNYFEVWL